MTVAVQRGARAMLREVVVFGRESQYGGRYHGELAVVLDLGVPEPRTLFGLAPAAARGRGAAPRRAARITTVLRLIAAANQL